MRWARDLEEKEEEEEEERGRELRDRDHERDDFNDDVDKGKGKVRRLKLLATYGVTEACVYQTAGEVFRPSKPGSSASEKTEGKGKGKAAEFGQNVGRPFPGVTVLIVSERDQGVVLATTDDEAAAAATAAATATTTPDSSLTPVLGEIVLTGSTLDELSCYYKSPHLSSSSSSPPPPFPPPRVKFRTVGPDTFYYTGDRGYISPVTGSLHVVGRIKGEEGMIKLNGVRVQLEEIECAVLSGGGDGGGAGGGPSMPDEGKVVKHCVCKAYAAEEGSDKNDRKIVVAYCLLYRECRSQLSLDKWQKEPAQQFICPSKSPLLTLLRTRCERALRPGCVPSYFVICQETELPLGPTGKSDWRALPLRAPSQCLVVKSLRRGGGGPGEEEEDPTLLKDLGSRVASILSAEIIAALNLQPGQQQLLTHDADFTSIGGDSLSAVLIMRKMWAAHSNVGDCKDLGGEFGELGEAFDPKYLISSRTLGAYVAFLEKNGVCASSTPALTSAAAAAAVTTSAKTTVGNAGGVESSIPPPPDASHQPLYDALLESCAMGWSAVSVALLLHGAPPQLSAAAGAAASARAFAKAKDRATRKKVWSSQPLHIACLRGECDVVDMLLKKGAKAMMPDATGTFPIHYACTGKGRGRTAVPAKKKGKTNEGSAVAPANGKDEKNDKEEDVEEEEEEEEEEVEEDDDENNDADGGGGVLVESGDTEARTECVRLLLDVGKVSLTSKTTSKQTVLHSASKAGHLNLLKFLLARWKAMIRRGEIRIEPTEAAAGRTSLDWRDHWNRSCIHWAVMHGYEDVLKLLLAEGVSPTPLLTGTKNKRGSLRRESPLQIAERLHGAGGGPLGDILRAFGAVS